MNGSPGGTKAKCGRWLGVALLLCCAVALAAAAHGCGGTQAPPSKGVVATPAGGDEVGATGYDATKCTITFTYFDDKNGNCVDWKPVKPKAKKGEWVCVENESSCALDVGVTVNAGAYPVFDPDARGFTLEAGKGKRQFQIADSTKAEEVEFFTNPAAGACKRCEKIQPLGAGGPGMDICPPKC